MGTHPTGMLSNRTALLMLPRKVGRADSPKRGLAASGCAVRGCLCLPQGWAAPCAGRGPGKEGSLASSCLLQVEVLIEPTGPANAGSVPSSRDQESPSRALLPNLGSTVATDEHFSSPHGMSGFTHKVKSCFSECHGLCQYRALTLELQGIQEYYRLLICKDICISSLKQLFS